MMEREEAGPTASKEGTLRLGGEGHVVTMKGTRGNNLFFGKSHPGVGHPKPIGRATTNSHNKTFKTGDYRLQEACVDPKK